jgi:putative redox protein
MAETNTYRAEMRWVTGLQFVGRGLASNGPVVMDGAVENGGLGSGIRPMEALLTSLASCSGMDVISILQKKRQRVTGFTVEVEGQRADEHPRRYVHIALTYVVRGHGVDEAAVARAVELSLTKYCGVTASLNSEIVSSYRIEEEEA